MSVDRVLCFLFAGVASQGLIAFCKWFSVVSDQSFLELVVFFVFFMLLSIHLEVSTIERKI